MPPQRPATLAPDFSDIPDAPPTGRASGAGPVGTKKAAASVLAPDFDGIPDAPPGGLLSSASHFVGSALRRGIGEPLKAAYNLGTTAITDPGKALGDVAMGLVEPVAEHAVAAGRARQEGRWLDYADQIARGVPIVGPLVGSVVDRAVQGDVSGAAGEAVGDVLPIAALKGLSTVRATKATTSRIPLTRAERTGSPMAGFVSNLTERTVAGAPRFQQFRAEQQAALQTEASTLASAIDRGVRARGDVGRLVQNAIQVGKNALQERATAIYGDIDRLTESTEVQVPVTSVKQVPSTILGPNGQPLIKDVSTTTNTTQRVGGAQPRTDALKAFALKELKRIGQEEELIPSTELARTKGILQAIAESPERVTFKAMQDARSDLLKIARSHGDPIPGKAGGMAKQLAGRMDDAMMQAAGQLGGEPLQAMVREANATWEQLKNVYNSTFIQKLAEGSPEKVPSYIRHADVDQIAMLQEHLPQRVYNAARGRVMRDLIGESTTPPPSAANNLANAAGQFTGITPEGVSPTPVSPVLNGPKLRQKLAALGPEKTDILFGKNATASLEDLANLADRVRPQSAKMLQGLIAGGVNATIFSPILHLWGLNLGSVGLSAATYAGFNATAQLLTRPQGLTAYRALLRGMNTGNTRMATLAGLSLTRQLNAANDVSYPTVSQDALDALSADVTTGASAPPETPATTPTQ